MCGIAGVIDIAGKNHLTEHINKMTDLLKHRGPDDEGFAFFDSNDFVTAGGEDTHDNVWQSRYHFSPAKRVEEVEGNYSVAFGFRRLSIIDLSPAGHQPMCSQDKSIWIVYNGEIYNYIELREDLKKRNYEFQTNTDTEVMIAAYQEWGEKCVDKFNGMWAFVIYDRRKNIFFGARDRFGVKPFYYYLDNDVFAFASEQKALVKLSRELGIKTGINKKMVFDYFALGEIEADEESFFKNIIELMPSYAFRFDLNDKTFNKWQYYQLSVNDQFQSFNDLKLSEYSHRTKELIINAIKVRLRSDVPVGSCLSGGLDSSVIVSVINQLLKEQNIEQIGERQKVFTSSFRDKRFDESDWAKIVVDQTQAEWHQTFPNSNDLLKDIETLAYCQDVPIWNTSTYAQFSVMRLAKENGIKVLLDGQGGDELFGGYKHYYVAYLMELLKNHQYNMFFKEMNKLDSFPANVKFLFRNYLKYYGVQKLPVDVIAAINKFYFADMKYINADVWSQHKNRFPRSQKNDHSSLNQMLYNEFNNSYLKGYLKCEDRCSMWFSIESRTPFADDVHLIEYLFQLPSVYKINNGNTKLLMRDSMKGILPEKIRSRKDKMGYVTPNLQWLNKIKNEVKQYFTNDLEEYIDVKKLLKDYDKLFNNDTTSYQEKLRIFKFISFALWKKVYNL